MLRNRGADPVLAYEPPVIEPGEAQLVGPVEGGNA
jgi:hypothetical protein